MKLTPNNILKGRTSSGERFTIRDWSFDVLAPIEMANFFLLLSLALLTSSFIAPVLTLLTLFFFKSGFRLSYLLILIVGGYMLIDAYNGWLMLTVLNLFMEESSINKLVLVNAISVFITLLLVFFNGFIANYITRPMTSYTEEEFLAMSTGQKKRLLDEVKSKKNTFNVIMIIIFFISIFLFSSFINPEKGWVERNIKVELEEVKYEDTLTPKERKEREEYFEKIEKRWGN